MADATASLNRATADIPLTRDARDDLEHASDAASSRGATEANPVDVLRAVLANRGSLASTALRNLRVDPNSVEAQLPVDGPPTTLPLRQLLVNANREAQVLGHYQVDSIHLLLSLLYTDSPATSSALQRSGLTMYDLRRHLQTGARADSPVGVRPTGTRAPDRALRRRPWPKLRGAVGISWTFVGLLAVVVASGVLLWIDLFPQGVTVLTLVFVLSGWIASVCVHEFFHAVVAYLGGDTSMTRAGYLSLNPLKYTNVVVSIALPVIFLLLGGVPLPGGAVYIDRGALRSKWWDSAVSLAGPVGTFLCGLLAAAIFAGSFLVGIINSWNSGFFEALAVLGSLQFYALILNLLPIPPLDGFGILRPWLPYSIQAFAARLGWYGLLILFAAVWYVPALSFWFSSAGDTLASTFGINSTFVYFGFQHFRLR